MEESVRNLLKMTEIRLNDHQNYLSEHRSHLSSDKIIIIETKISMYLNFIDSIRVLCLGDI